jgi:hypothetical protein
MSPSLDLEKSKVFLSVSEEIPGFYKNPENNWPGFPFSKQMKHGNDPERIFENYQFAASILSFPCLGLT